MSMVDLNPGTPALELTNCPRHEPSRDATPGTLAQALAPHAVGFDVLEMHYQPMLRLVRELIGVVPNCDQVLEIWPAAFRSYNLLVPSLLHLPPSLFGLGAPKNLVGLAMYTSSRAAECAYCSAHCCSYALRRGATAGSVTGQRTPLEAAVIRLAEAISHQPHDLSPEDVASLRELLPEKHVVRVVASVALMGFLNKFMDAMGIELEPEAAGDIARLIGPTGWSPGQHQWADAVVESRGDLPPVDSFSTLWRVLHQAPGAIRLERHWTKGVPSDAMNANRYLLERTGIECPILTELPDHQTVRALTSVLVSNLDAGQSCIGLVPKGLAGLIFAGASGSAELGLLARQIVRRQEISDEQNVTLTGAPGARIPEVELDAVERLSMMPVEQADWSALSSIVAESKSMAVVRLAHAVSTSPARVSRELIVETCNSLSPAEIVETVCWISINQLMHRLIVFRDQATQ